MLSSVTGIGTPSPSRMTNSQTAAYFRLLWAESVRRHRFGSSATSANARVSSVALDPAVSAACALAVGVKVAAVRSVCLCHAADATDMFYVASSACASRKEATSRCCD